MAKRHIPAGQVAEILGFTDFEMLQADVNQIAGVEAAQTKSAFAPTTDEVRRARG